MPTSEKKREACRRNAQKSTGPKRTYLTRFNAVKRGSYAKEFVPRGADEKPFRQLEKNLRADLQPQGELQEIYFRRALSKEWAIRGIDRSVLSYVEKTASENRSNSPADADAVDAELLALKPRVDEVYAQSLAARTNSKETVPKPAAAKLTEAPIEPADIDRAVLEGFAHPGLGGELSRLHQEKTQLEHGFDLAIKGFRAAQRDQAIEIVPGVVSDGNDEGPVRDQISTKNSSRDK